MAPAAAGWWPGGPPHRGRGEVEVGRPRARQDEGLPGVAGHDK